MAAPPSKAGFVDHMERLPRSAREIVRLLETPPLFAEMNARERQWFADFAEVVRCAMGTVAFAPGEEGQYLYVVLQGSFELRVKAPNGAYHRMHEIGVGRTAGGDALLAKLPHRTQCVSVEASAALRFNFKALHAAIAANSTQTTKMCTVLRAELSEQIRDATDQLVGLLAGNLAKVQSAAPSKAAPGLPEVGADVIAQFLRGKGDVSSPLGRKSDISSPLGRNSDISSPLGRRNDISSPLPSRNDRSSPLGGKDISTQLPPKKK